MNNSALTGNPDAYADLPSAVDEPHHTSPSKAPHATAHHSRPAAWVSTTVDLQHIPFQLVRSKLKPRRQVFHDPQEHVLIVETSRCRRKHRDFEFLLEGEYHPGLVVVPRLPRLLALDIDNISWHVCVSYLIGSILLIINGHFITWPINGDGYSQTNMNLVGYSALLSSIFWNIGAYLMYVESLNENATEEVVWEERTLKEEPADVRRYIKRCAASTKYPTSKSSTTINNNGPRNLTACEVLYSPSTHGKKSSNYTPQANTSSTNLAPGLGSRSSEWRWWGTETSSFGWWISLLQGIGCIFFLMSSIAAFPGVLGENQWKLEKSLILVPLTICSVLFLTTSTLTLLEEQQYWYLPALDRIGWHSCFWNL